MTTTLSNARIVLEHEVVHGSLRIEDGRIAEVSDDPGAPGTDLRGDYLLPGIVELHTDQLETHFQPRPGRFWDPISAVIAHDSQMAASGVTTVFDATRIGSGPAAGAAADHARTLVGAVIEAAEAGLLRADHYVHLRCEVSTPDVVELFDELGGHERVRMVSLMDHTPGQRQYADVEAFRTYMVGKGRITNEQFETLVADLHELSARYADPHRRLMAARAAARGILIAAHDDATPAHVEESAALGVGVSEFPTTVQAARAAREAGQLIVMGAPNLVRGGSHSGNASAADLLALGLLDIFSSDYVPASLIQAVFRLRSRGEMTLPEAMALVSGNPARAAGFADRGAIAAGLRADLVRVREYREDAGTTGAAGVAVPVVRGVWSAGERVS